MIAIAITFWMKHGAGGEPPPAATGLTDESNNQLTDEFGTELDDE